MTGPIVAGYTATTAGRDAVVLAARLARATSSVLDLVVVLPAGDRSVITPPSDGYQRYLHDQADEWLAETAAWIPDTVQARRHVVDGESFGEGLIAAAQEFEASHIVVGAAEGSLPGRHRLGSTTTELLHSSDIPIALAPQETTDAAAPVTRITAAIGSLSGASAVLQEAIELATATSAPLRLLSLVAVDLPATIDTGLVRLTGATHAQAILAQALAELPAGVAAEVVLGHGDSIEQAVESLDWEPGELALVGSSRLAQPRRLFLGSTAAKMLRALPVPMIVVPRIRHQDGEQS